MWLSSLIAFLFLLPSLAFAQTFPVWTPQSGPYTPPTPSRIIYYVNTVSGSDSLNGLSVDNAFKTINKAMTVNSNWVGRGVRIIGTPGVIIREKVNVNGGGTTATWPTSEADRSYITPYDNVSVIIDKSGTSDLTGFGSNAWTVHSGSIYKATYSVDDSNPDTPIRLRSVLGIAAVVIDNNFKTYKPVASLAGVVSEGQWYFDKPTLTLYVWTPASIGDPDDHDVILVDQENSGDNYSCVSLPTNAKYITIEGLTERGASGPGIISFGYQTYVPANNNFDNNVIVFNGKGGIVASNQTNSKIRYNYIYGNIMKAWPRGMWSSSCTSWGGWPSAMGGAANDNVQYKGNIVRDNGGEGSLNYSSSAGNIWEENIFVDNFSVNIYIDRHPNSIVRNNLVYSSGQKLSDMRNDCGAYPEESRFLCGTWGDGIVFSNEAVSSNKARNLKVYNNLVVNMLRGISMYPDYDTDVYNDDIFNNTIVVATVDPYTSQLWRQVTSPSGILLRNTYATNVNSNVKNNVIIAAGDNAVLLDYLSSGQTDAGVSIDNNIYYYTGASSTPFKYKGTKYSWANWKTQSSKDSGSAYADPGLTGTNWAYPIVAIPDPFAGTSILLETGIVDNNFKAADNTSITIDTGVTQTLFSADFNNTSRPQGLAWDKGAFEYNGQGGTDPPGPPGPGAPIALAANPYLIFANQVTWNPVDNATSYNIYWSTTVGVTKATGTKITGATSPYTHLGLVGNKPYYYVVTAVNANGESVDSAEITASPKYTIGTPAGTGAWR